MKDRGEVLTFLGGQQVSAFLDAAVGQALAAGMPRDVFLEMATVSYDENLRMLNENVPDMPKAEGSS